MAFLFRQTRGVVISTEEGLALLQSGTYVEQKEIGRTKRTRNSIFYRTNFWIGQSRPYVGGHKLTLYWHMEPLERVYQYIQLHWLFLVFFVVSLLAPLSSTFAFIMFIFGAGFLVVFTQNMYVNLRTMPHVLRQPSVPNHSINRSNQHYEITVERYRSLVVGSSEVVSGFVGTATGKMRYQVFQESAVGTMKLCFVLSSICFILASVTVSYCLAWSIVALIDKRY